ncbi:hypothetical protein ScPMuIL_009524 [Solemya velum]
MSDRTEQLRVSLQKFVDHVEEFMEDDDDPAGNGLYKEYRGLREIAAEQKENNVFPATEGRQAHNLRKNRYKDILPFDETRVTLGETPGENDYINANFIKDYRGNAAYIASQGPLPQTVDDFWRMVWENDVKVIIMACKLVETGRKKCEMYWPENIGEKKEFGSVTVTLESERNMTEDLDDCIIRTLIAMPESLDGVEPQKVIQYQYTGWPDHGIPDEVDTIIEMIAEMRKIKDMDPDRCPYLIHCSAGCGRTGAICAIDYAWELLKSGNLKDDFSLYQIIKDMREQRPSMVQTPDQYEMVHLAVKCLFEEHISLIDDHIYSNFEPRNSGYNNVVVDNGNVCETKDSPDTGKDQADSDDLSEVCNKKGVRQPSKKDVPSISETTVSYVKEASQKYEKPNKEPAKENSDQSAPRERKKPSISELMGAFQEPAPKDKSEASTQEPQTPNAVETKTNTTTHNYKNLEFPQSKEKTIVLSTIQASTQETQNTSAKKKPFISTITISNSGSKITSSRPQDPHYKNIQTQSNKTINSSTHEMKAPVIKTASNSDSVYSEIGDPKIIPPEAHGIQRTGSNRGMNQKRESYIEEIKLRNHSDSTDNMYAVVNVDGSKSKTPTSRMPSEDLENPPIPHRGYQDESSNRQKGNKDVNGSATLVGKFKKFITGSSTTLTDQQEPHHNRSSSTKGFGVRGSKPNGPRSPPAYWASRTSK